MATVAPANAAVYGSLNAGTTRNATSETEDRFLKLLVAQIQNQDPLNPLDNHQVTSQMAQINTVNGIDKLNRTVAALGTQFATMQAMQGVSLVGREVTVPGDRLAVDGGRARGSFELAGPADQVKVEILNGAGRVIDTLQLGKQTAGRHDFDWTVQGQESGLRFRVSATSGQAAVESVPLVRQKVDAVSVRGDTLVLELADGRSIAWSDVRAFN